jgi:membrane protein implicated in regulation of membrane protease activity
MDLWVIWIIVAAVFAIGEIITLGFFLAPFAVGALAAALVDGVGGGTGLSVTAFVLVSLLSFGIVRPIARAHRRQPPALRTGTEALLGRPATVLEAIDNRSGVGSVKLEGEVWTARAFDEDRTFSAGERVEVVQIRGATALVD